jgi:hypothetical protein
VTNGAYTIPKGLVQLETGVQHSRVTAAGETTATPLSARAGIAHWAELRIETDGVTRNLQAGSASTDFAGLMVGAKVRLWAPAGGSPALALMPEITLPWGRSGGGTDYGVRFASGGDITDVIHLDVNYGLTAIASGESHVVQQLASASSAISIGRHWQPYVEVYWLSKSDLDARPSASLDAGTIYFVKQRLAVDAGLAFGLSAAADGLAVFGGLSVILGEIGTHRGGVPARLRDAQLRGDR